MPPFVLALFSRPPESHSAAPLATRTADKGKSKTWPERKFHTIDFIKNAGRDMKLLSCADKLANIRDIINAQKDSVAWYYNSYKGSDSNLELLRE